MSKAFNALKDLTVDELKTKLNQLRLELAKHNAQRQSSINSKVASQIRKTRKDIARILTLLNSMSNKNIRQESLKQLKQKLKDDSTVNVQKSKKSKKQADIENKNK